MSENREGRARPGALERTRPGYYVEGTAASLDNSRRMKEKSHRVSRRCYRSGVDALRGTHTRRLDGYRVYSASPARIRGAGQAGGGPLRHAARQFGRWRHPAEGDRHAAWADQAPGRVPRRPPPALEGPASGPRAAPPARVWDRLWVCRLQRRRAARGRRDPQAVGGAPARPSPRSPRSRGSRMPWARGS